MLPIAASNEADGEKEQGFAQENTTSKDRSSLAERGGDFVVQIHKRSKARVPTLSFAEQADTFAIRERKYGVRNELYLYLKK